MGGARVGLYETPVVGQDGNFCSCGDRDAVICLYAPCGMPY